MFICLWFVLVIFHDKISRKSDFKKTKYGITMYSNAMQWNHMSKIRICLTKATFNYDCKGNNYRESQCETEEFIVRSCCNKRVICLNLFQQLAHCCTCHKYKTWRREKSEKQHAINAHGFFDIVECPFTGAIFPLSFWLREHMLEKNSIHFTCKRKSISFGYEHWQYSLVLDSNSKSQSQSQSNRNSVVHWIYALSVRFCSFRFVW